MKRYTVILADDHPLFLYGLREALDRASAFEVMGSYHDGRDALDALCRTVPDLALVDLRMPEMSGMQIIEELAKQRLPTRGILMTGRFHQRAAERLQPSDAWGILYKDSTPDLFVRDLLWIAGQSRRVAVNGVPSAPGGDEIAAPLTNREREVAAWACQGLANKEIARELGLTEGTVKLHLNKVYQKTGSRNRTELAFMNSLIVPAHMGKQQS